jgi:hypothetical protein
MFLVKGFKKTLIFFFPCPVLSGKFGNQSLRFRTTKTFFFDKCSWIFCAKNETPGSYEPGKTILYFPECCLKEGRRERRT